MRQKGFTLIELLVVLAVSSVLLTGAVLTMHQVVWGTGRSSSQVVALTDINQATLRIKRDLMMTQETDLPDGVPQSSVTLSWTDYTSFGSENQTRSHSGSYTLSGTELLRTYDGTESVAGRNITSVTFTKDAQDGRIINVVITATGSGASQRNETLKFRVYLRTEELE